MKRKEEGTKKEKRTLARWEKGISQSFVVIHMLHIIEGGKKRKDIKEGGKVSLSN